MRFKAFWFYIELWPSVTFSLAFPLLVGLGVWQLDRADQKRELWDTRLQRENLAPLDLNRPFAKRADPEYTAWRKIIAKGRYDPEHQFLLDNQTVDGRAGYFVYTPFRLEPADIWVMVNRGWVPSGRSRQMIPDLTVTSESIVVHGVAKAPPRPAILLPGAEPEKLASGTWRVQFVDLVHIRNELARELLPYVVRLEANAQFGFVRKWSTPRIGEQRHIAYAVQWFALAIALAILYFRSDFIVRQARAGRGPCP